MINDHVLREGERVADSAAEAKAATFVASAIQHRDDLLQAHSDLMEGGRAIMLRLAEKGADPLVRAKAREDYISRGVADLVSAKADDRDHVGAAAMLDQFNQFLTNPQDLARAKRVVEQATTMGQSMQIVDDLMKTDPTPQGVIDRAKAIEDPVLRKAVEDRGFEMLRLRHAAHEAGQGQIMADIYKAIKAGASPSPSQLAKLDPANRERLDQWSRPEKIPWQDSKAIRYQFQQALADPIQRQQMAGSDLRQYLFRVNEDDFQAMVAMQEDARQGAGSINTFQDRVDAAFVELTKTPPKPYTISNGRAETNPQYVAWVDAVEREAQALAQAGNRKKPNAEDAQKAIDAVLQRKVRLDEIGSDPEVVAAVVPAKDRKSAYVPIDQIPDGNRSALRERLRSYGVKDISDDLIQRAYAALNVLRDDALYRKIIEDARH
jgi:hypothetical protein